MEGTDGRAKKGEHSILTHKGSRTDPLSLFSRYQIYQDKTVESMARWNQEKKSHQSSGFVQSDVIVNEFEESESDDSDDATGQHGHLLADGLLQFDNNKPRINGMKSNSSKVNRKM